ncbi:DUF3833 domain-containing protein [Vibrio sp. V39_P1S14PM300]|uniref:DUF3833 domain-containing protein n=1 Tax=Vibrio sp. V39_P1S14PM300 TaxID=1938690 RepID=UPI00137341B6|nr:DUF3833 domain-containing protein [Vibrio sp. V39_P1S14PM300]NAX20063.1 DUF3833 family protein [Vibrio sp. V39_P1S14PM300]
MKWMVAMVSSLLLMVGCSTDVGEYQQATPRFDLFEFFQGDLTAWGMIQDYSDKQTRRFEVQIQGQVDGDTLTLVEDFVFDDGETDQRVWVIKRVGDKRYQGQADDIVGVASGEEMGNVLQWKYDFELPRGDSTVTVTFDDWLYRQDDKRAFNVTKIRKLGFEVGRLTIFFEKQ